MSYGGASTMSLTILHPGLCSTIQDNGRYGLQCFGFSNSGAMDLSSLMLANLLTGNHPYEACIEMTYQGITAKFNSDCVIAITGAFMNPRIDGKKVSQNRALFVKSGSYLNLTCFAPENCRTYLSVGGGFDLPKILGSRSTSLKFEIGGLDGRKLASSDVLTFRQSQKNLDLALKNKNNRILSLPKNNEKVVKLRVILGPQNDMFKSCAIKTFLSSKYDVTSKSDRMGIRLDGPVLQAIDSYDIISDGIVNGSIQVPQNGQPIILLADRQTTGGYTKIATIISVDLPLAGQLTSQNQVTFESIDIKTAQKLYSVSKKKYSKLYKDINHTNIKF